MARLRVASLAFGIACVSSACGPAEVPTTDPLAGAEASMPDPIEEPEAEPIVASAGADEGFTVTLGSRCGDTWKGAIVRGAGGDPGRFEIPSQSTRELKLVKGDALLLTTPHGGIMSLQFDNLTAGYGARVEVTPECSGVKQTVVPR